MAAHHSAVIMLVSLTSCVHSDARHAAARPGAGIGRWLPTLDFLPLLGDTSKFGGRVPARIQRNNLRPVDWAVAGFSSWSLDDVQDFNASFDKTYHLGHNDCRDYASRLVSHMTGVKVAPGTVLLLLLCYVH